ncbi:MAG: 2-oxoacid:acceptor oxidoreductase subunit alpha [Planctomycetota bacterium]|nr:MAG: 2-oxoacid:acceptor oxidoreductase subunit alpha [Planctomycetota bacterium]
MSTEEVIPQTSRKPIQELETVVVRFAGDSGDGMQLAGMQMTNVSAAFGNDVSTLPDFPAEIRAPAGTTAGVSGYQLCFSAHDIYTPGDEVDTLVAMNPAALRTNIADLKRGGTLIVNEDAFEPNNLRKAGYDSNPLDDPKFVSSYRVFRVPMTRLTRDAVKGLGLSVKEADRCKNFFALGLVYWLYDRDPTPTINWAKQKFAKSPAILEANLRALKAGWNYGESTEAFTVHYRVPPAKLPPGRYRKISGNEAIAYGLAALAHTTGKTVFYAGYPITPASDILHGAARLKNFNVITFQAEDEIAAMSSVVGAAFSGQLAVTGSSGPGICLKAEAMGLGLMTELPMVIIDVQRGGPSTGLPTKTEQADLLLVMFGRNGDAPLPVVAAATPGDCFWMIQEAMRLAVEAMVPVVLLSDGYIANGAEPWRIPSLDELPEIKIEHPTAPNDDGRFLPYLRDERLRRPWAIPGTPGLEHRLGGLEKEDGTGNVCYDPQNHQRMTEIRAKKVALLADVIPEQDVHGPEQGDLLVVSWGGTFGSVRTAVEQCQREGLAVAHAHLRYLNPFPKNLGEILQQYKTVLVPELNTGQLRLLLRSRFLVDAHGLNKIQGKPFLVHEITDKIHELVGELQPV